MAQTNRLQAVGSPEPIPDLIGEPPRPQAPPVTPSEQKAMTMLLIALKALSQRTLVALASMVDLALVASVFVLWLQVIAQPSTFQLIGLGVYALFVLVVLWIRRGKD